MSCIILWVGLFAVIAILVVGYGLASPKPVAIKEIKYKIAKYGKCPPCSSPQACTNNGFCLVEQVKKELSDEQLP